MAKLKSSRRAPPKSGSHTRAWHTFEQNLDVIDHMISRAHRELNVEMSAIRRFESKVEKYRGARIAPSDYASLVRSLERRVASLNARHAQLDNARLWEVVMLVTCVEAYLQDVLASAASADTDLMSKSEQSAAYRDVMAAASLQELAHELRSRWARGWLRDGGPTAWITRLQRMGARDYPDDLATNLERIWGVRHVVVHLAGIADADFMKRHPGLVAVQGDRVRVTLEDFKRYLAVVRAFMESTEKFFVARYPSMGIAA